MTLRTFSYGGGVQSTAALVLAARGEIDFRTFLFCNVGDDSERKSTLAYIAEHAVGFAAKNGLDLIELRRIRRDGTPETLYGRLIKPGSRSLPIPVRMPDTGAPTNRACTVNFKIEVVAKWLRQHGATKKDPAVTGLGISLDEVHRARSSSGIAYQTLEYPLLELGIRRSDCHPIIESAGLPVPPKSACWFCPFHAPSEWARMRREEPGEFAAAAHLEETLNARRDMLGKDHVYLTRFGKPLPLAIPDGAEQLTLDGFACESGYCGV